MTTERSSYSDPGGERLQEAASGVADRVAETAGTQVNTGMTKASEVLEQIAGAVRTSGDQLRDEQPQVASFADTAAGQVERFARYLQDANPQEVMHEAEDFARRQPAIFLGGAFALGLLASRFLKASPTDGSSAYRYQRYGSGFGSARANGGNGSYPADYAGGMGYARGRGYDGGGYSTSGSTSAPVYAAGTPVMSGSATTRSTRSTATGTSETGVEHGGA